MNREGEGSTAFARSVYVADESRPVFTLARVLDDEACAALIAFAEQQGFDDAPVTTARGPRMMRDVRNNTRVMVDAPALAERLFGTLASLLPRELPEGWRLTGLNERLRFYRYDAGQSFEWHYDGSFARNNDERSQLTLLFYLNDGFVGGETEFDDVTGSFTVVPSRGDALVFAHHVRHRGAPVREGRKYALRTDVMYQRNP